MVQKKFDSCPECGWEREYVEQLGSSDREWDECANPDRESNRKEPLPPPDPHD